MEKGIDMKKILILLPVLLLLLVGCGEKPKETTVSVSKKGVVTQTIIEKWDQDDYDQAEFESNIAEQIGSYGSDAVRLKSCEVKKGMITVVLEYDSVADYGAFNGVQCFDGTIAEADQAGLIMNGTYYDTDGAEISQHKVLDESSDYRVFILNEPVAVCVPGKVVYVRAGAQITGKSTVKITGEEDITGKQEEAGSSGIAEASVSSLPETSQASSAEEHKDSVNDQWLTWLAEPGIIVYKYK